MSNRSMLFGVQLHYLLMTNKFGCLCIFLLINCPFFIENGVIGSLRNVGIEEFYIYESIYKMEKLLNRKIQRYDGLLKIELLHARNCCNLYLQGINNSVLLL